MIHSERYSIASRRTIARTPTLLLMVTLAVSPLMAQGSATASQTLRLEVLSRAAFRINGNSRTLLNYSKYDGRANQQSVASSAASYSVSSNRPSLKLSASINEPLPDRTRLLVQLASSRGTSTGSVDLSNAVTPVDVVTSIGTGNDAGQHIAYQLFVDNSTDITTARERTVTFTVTD